MKSIAVLLTVFNRKKKTLDALQNLYAQRLPKGYNLDVFMVDDGCTDGTAAAVKSTFPKTNVISANGELFWNRGMNLAWQIAVKANDYDFYLWLNDDTILNDNAITVLVQTCARAGNQTIVVGTTSSLTDTSSLTYGGRTANGQVIIPTNEALPCAYFNGNIVLIPKYVYNRLGPNDPFFRHALGDFDYGKRASKIGIKSLVAPSVLGRCNGHDTLPVWCNPEKSFIKRWKAFRSPLGNNPEEFFVYESRHGGKMKAVFHYFTNHLRVFWPQLWKLKPS